jgi:hypothetical protein
MVRDPVSSHAPAAQQGQSGVPASPQPSARKQASCARKKPRQLMDGSGTGSQWVATSLQPAFGDLLSEERKRLNLSPIAMASRSASHITAPSTGAIDRRFPGFATDFRKRSNSAMSGTQLREAGLHRLAYAPSPIA